METDYEKFARSFREEMRRFDIEMKTKHLKKKAEKKKITRRLKHDKVVVLEHVRCEMLRDVEYRIKNLRTRNAADCDVVAFINKKYAQIRQIMSD